MTRWIVRLFDASASPVRLVALLVLSVGYLVLLRDPTAPPSAVDWAFALGSVLASAASTRWPLATSLAESGLLAAAFQLGDTGPVVVKIAASLALFELAVRRAGWPLAVAAAALTAVYFLHPDRDPLALLYRATVVTGAPLLLGAYVRSARELATQAQREAAERERRRQADIAAAKAAERTAIAREMHDLVAHHVASMVLRVGVAQHVLDPADPNVRAVLDDIHASSSAALADLRRLVAVLRDPGLGGDTGLVQAAELPAALATIVERSRQVGLEVTTELDAPLATLDAVRGLAVLRVTQEGLTNVAKHAGPAAHAQVTIQMDGEGAVTIQITDDGGPAMAHSAEPPGRRGPGGAAGHGLIGMRERVELLGGSLHAGPHGRGWRLLALLPAAGRQDRDWPANASAVLPLAGGGGSGRARPGASGPPAHTEVAEQPR
jgi:signal transduction histidine kinase